MFRTDTFVNGSRRNWATDVDRGCIVVSMLNIAWSVDLEAIERLVMDYEEDDTAWSKRLSPEFWEWVPEQ